MQVRWYGQSAFRLVAEGKTVFIDPFGDFGPQMAARGMRFDYPAIGDVTADLLLITHEHGDHNAVEVIKGAPQVIRSTAGTLDSPVGTVVAIASEHDDVAGTRRGPNSIFCFSLGGLRICHFGDFGQLELRAEQAEAAGRPDLLFVPVGGGPTAGAQGAAAIVERLQPKWVVPMHYRTPAISFLEPPDAFFAMFNDVRHIDRPEFDTRDLGAPGAGPAVLVPAVPTAG